MNKKALLEIVSVPQVILIMIVLGIIFSAVALIDSAKTPDLNIRVEQNQQIEKILNEYLSTPIIYKSQKINIEDLIIISVMNNNFNLLDEETQKIFKELSSYNYKIEIFQKDTKISIITDSGGSYQNKIQAEIPKNNLKIIFYLKRK